MVLLAHASENRHVVVIVDPPVADKGPFEGFRRLDLAADFAQVGGGGAAPLVLVGGGIFGTTFTSA